MQSFEESICACRRRTEGSREWRGTAHTPRRVGVERTHLVKRAKAANLRDMLIEAIREFNRAVPFQPYEIRTNGGKRLKVPHPDFIFISPKGSWVIVTDEQERPRHISSLLIKEVSPLPARLSRKRTTKSK